MKIWLIKSSEPMPVVNSNERLLRMGLLAEELSSRGHQVTWFANTFDHFQKKQLYKKNTTVKVKENYNLELLHAIGYKRNISVSRIINHKVIAKKFQGKAKKMEKPDVIYVSFPTIDYAEQAVKYGQKYNVPVIVDIRDLWPDIFKHNLPKLLSYIVSPYIAFMNYKTKKIMREAYAINGVSELVMKWGLNKGNRKKSKNDRYFYIGYDKKENVQYSEDECKKLIDKNKFNISFFATINNQFDYDKIIELAQSIEAKDKDVVINVCGDGPQLSGFKEKANNISNIKFHGWVDKKKLNIILQNTDIGLAPYKNTFDFQMSVSNKFGEYVSYGLPVIITSGGYMKELVEKHKCGMSTQNMEEMCEFIIKLKNNPEEYKEMSKNAMKLYEENFVAEKIYKELADYLEKIEGEN